MPRVKKVMTTAEQVSKLPDIIAEAAAKASDDALIAEWGDEVQPAPEFDAYQLATLAATQLTVTPHDSNDIIDLRIDRALFIAGKLLAKAKEVQ